MSIVEMKGEPRDLLEKYDRISEAMSKVPVAHGLIFHACVGIGDGIRVVNVFETEEQARTARLRPKFQEALRDAEVPEQVPIIYPVHNYRISKRRWISRPRPVWPRYRHDTRLPHEL